MKLVHKITHFFSKYKSYIFIGLIILLALKVFIPQIDNLKDSIAALKDANMTWVITGLVVYFFGLPILALQYMSLAIKPIVFWLTLRVQFAGLFVSKLLPSSLGTISLNYYYFMQKNHTAVESGTVMAMNGITSGIAYLGLIVAAVWFGDIQLGGVLSSISLSFPTVILIITGLTVLSVFIYRIPSVNSKIKSIIQDIKISLNTYKDRPMSLVWATICNGAGSFTSLFALYASAHAIGVDLSIPEALLAYTFGNIAAGLVPTPGGIGAVEAGIYAGLVLVGVDEANAITVTLIYRLISYWIPIIPGYISFARLKKDVLAKFSIKQKNPEPKTQ